MRETQRAFHLEDHRSHVLSQTRLLNVRLRRLCRLPAPPLRAWNQHLGMGSDQPCVSVKRRPTRDSLLWDVTLEHTSGTFHHMATLHSLGCPPLCHLSSVSHIIFCDKFLLVIYNSLRLEALIRNHLGHVKLSLSEEH